MVHDISLGDTCRHPHRSQFYWLRGELGEEYAVLSAQGALQKEHALKTRPRDSSGRVVVNAASYLLGISPGGLATIFGENLTTVNGVVVAGVDPLPGVLSRVSVFVNGAPALIFSIAYAGGEDQISFQAPYDTATGKAAAAIMVVDYNVQIADFITDSYTEYPSPPFADTIDPAQVLLDNEPCLVVFSGLSPGFVGLYQVNFQVPDDAPAGNLDLEIQTPYASSNTATLPVE